MFVKLSKALMAQLTKTNGQDIAGKYFKLDGKKLLNSEFDHVIIRCDTTKGIVHWTPHAEVVDGVSYVVATSELRSHLEDHIIDGRRVYSIEGGKGSNVVRLHTIPTDFTHKNISVIDQFFDMNNNTPLLIIGRVGQ